MSDIVSDVVGGIGDIFTQGPDYLFGNNIPNAVQNPRVTSFTAPGLNATFTDPENLQVTRSPEVNSALSNVSWGFRNAARDYGSMIPLVEPGKGRLTEAAIRAVRDARRASMGDLRQNLSNRRVLGSSFAADDMNRTAAEFAKQENALTAQAFNQELALKSDLVSKQATANANAFLQTLQQANIESGLATQLASGVSGILSNAAGIIANMSNRGSNALWALGGQGVAAYTLGSGLGAFGGGSTSMNESTGGYPLNIPGTGGFAGY